MIWHSSDINDIKTELGFDRENGLNGGQVAERIKLYGENRTTVRKNKKFSKEFTKRLFAKENILLIILSLVMIITDAIAGKPFWYVPFVSMLIIIGGAVLGAFSALRNVALVKSLRDEVKVSAKVLREGEVINIDAALLVPGDIVILETGDYIPADGRILEENSLICDESAISGDSAPVKKDVDATPEDIAALEQRGNMVYSGCSVTYGRAVIVVTGTGRNTEIGKKNLITEQTVGSEIAVKKYLVSFGKNAGIVVLAFSVIIFVLGLIFIKNSGNVAFSDHVFGTLALAVSVYSVCLAKAIPEMVEAAVSFAAVRMERKNAVAVKPESIIDLGRTSVIISDKTGTLTKNNMKMASVWSGGAIIDLETEEPDENSLTLIRTGAMCCNGKIAFGAGGKEKHIGDPTEVAIIAALRDYLGISKDELENIYPRMADIPFESKRKLMTTVNMINNRPFAIVKGSFDILLSLCTGGNIKGAEEAALKMGELGQRVIGVAIKPLDEVRANPNSADLEKNLALLGLFGMTDSLSRKTKESLAMCKTAGIRVVMVTGDHITTAEAIAKQLGILSEGQKSLTGEKLSEMTDEELSADIKNIAVYSRITDSDKLRIVKAWQDLGETVAITGDSVEDAAALKEADIGFAMGITGTDIAKGTADIVLKDDSFIAVADAVKTARCAFYNIRHSVGLFMAAAIGQILTVLLGILMFKTTVIPTAGILLINLILMPLLSHSIAAEGDRKMSMKIPPIGKKEGLFSNIHHYDFVWQGVLLSVASLIGYGIFKVPGSVFGIFATSLLFLTFARKNCKNFYREGFRLGKNMIISLSACFVLILVVVFTPVSVVFSFGSAAAGVFAAMLGFGFSLLVICEVYKIITSLLKPNEAE